MMQYPNIIALWHESINFSGPVDASKTGFANYCSTIVCTVGQSYPLIIETRDCYDNPATFKTDHNSYFKIKVTDVSDIQSIMNDFLKEKRQRWMV